MPGVLDDDVRAAHAAVIVALRDDRSFTLVHGPDAVRFLQGVLSNDVATVRVGDGAYALLLTPKARVVADLRLVRIADDRLLVDCDAAAAGAVRAGLARYRLAAKAAIERADDEFAIATVVGPEAGKLLLGAFGVLPPADPREGQGSALDVDGTPVHAVASAGYGDKAFELVGPRPAVVAAVARLRERLAAHGGREAAPGALEVLRVEAGVPRFGAEIDEQVMPAEAGLVDRAVSFTKGCYVGQEPVARLHYRGHANRGLRTIVVDGPPPAAGTPVLVEGRDVGRVTSAVRSPTAAATVALAIVRREIDPEQRVMLGEDGPAGVVRPGPVYARPSDD